MGIKELIWGLFRSQRQVSSSTLAYNEIDSWLSQKSEVILTQHSFDENSQEYFTSFFNQLDELGRLILSSSILSVELYAVFTHVPHNSTSADWKEVIILHRSIKNTFQDLLVFSEQLEESGDTTLRAKILHIAEAIEKYDVFLNKIGLVAVLALHQRKERMDDFQLQIKEQHKIITSREQRLRLAQEHYTERRKELEQLENDPLFSSTHAQSREKDDFVARKEELENLIIEYFFTMRPLLLHYLELVDQPEKAELVQLYLHDPLVTFYRDEGLQIVHIVEHLRAAISTGKIPGSQHELDYFLLELRRIDLAELQHALISFNRQMDALSEVTVNTAFTTKLEDVRYRFNHFAEQVEREKNELERAQAAELNYKEMMQREIALFVNIAKMGLDVDINISSQVP